MQRYSARCRCFNKPPVDVGTQCRPTALSVTGHRDIQPRTRTGNSRAQAAGNVRQERRRGARQGRHARRQGVGNAGMEVGQRYQPRRRLRQSALYKAVASPPVRGRHAWCNHRPASRIYPASSAMACVQVIIRGNASHVGTGEWEKSHGAAKINKRLVSAYAYAR